MHAILYKPVPSENKISVYGRRNEKLMFCFRIPDFKSECNTPINLKMSAIDWLQISRFLS